MKIATTSWVGIPALSLLVSAPVHAHCPLCTAAVGALAVIAAKLGVGLMPIGLFVGAFSVALGLWLARLLKRQYLPRQKWFLVVFSFATTVFPLQVGLAANTAIYLPFWGEYGRTLVINHFVVGAVLGSLLMLLSPYLSRRLALVRGGKMYPFQGMLITLGLLASTAAAIELVA